MQSVKQIVQGVANSHLNSPLEFSLKGDTMQNSKHPILSALCAAMLCGAGFLTAAKAENLTELSYTSGSYTNAVNQAGHSITLIGGESESSRASFSKFENQAGASIEAIGGYAKFSGTNLNVFNNYGAIGSISGNAHFDEIFNKGRVDSISGEGVVFDRLYNGYYLQADSKDAYIGEISGGTFGDSGSGAIVIGGGGGASGTCKLTGRCFENIATIDKISGGTFKGGFNNLKSPEFKIEGKINEISGGTFEQLGNDGTITKISGGTFKELKSTTAGATNKPAIKNYGTIGEITGAADIESLLIGSGLASISQIWGQGYTDKGTGTINVISGGTIKKLDLTTESFYYDRATIGTISGGVIVELNSGTSENESGGFIGSITGGEITTLNNRLDSEIASISGGKITTLNNEAIVGDISGGSFKTFANTKAIANIASISGGSFEKLENSGIITDIINADIAALNNKGEVSISGTLRGNIANNSGGVVNFLMKTPDKLAQLEGDFTNSGGSANIDMSGAVLGKEYTLITGKSEGFDESNFNISTKSPNAQYLRFSHKDYKIVTAHSSQAFEQLQTQLSANEIGIAKNILTSDFDIMNSSALSDAESTIKESYIGTPQHIISNFKANSINSTPLGQGFGAVFTPTASEYKPTANADLLRFDNGYVVNSFVNEPKIEFFANPFYGELRGNGVKGSLGGVNLGLGYLDENYALQGSFNYAYATSSQDLATQSTDTTAYMFQVGLLGQLFFADLVEIDINANYLLGKFKMSNIWLADSTLNSSSKFDNHQGNVGVAAGLRFGSEFSIKPFVGLQNYFESQGKYSVLGFESEKYSDYALNGVAGIEGRAKIGDLSFLYARVSGEFNFVENKKELFMVNKELNAELKYANETYKNSVSAGLGAQIFATDSVKLSIEGLYKYHDSGLNYYGGSLGVRVAF